MRAFHQVDVFTDTAFLGNPVAVVHDAEGLRDEQLAAFAHWTNLSETTFLLAPTDPTADYRLRILTTQRELPFAGHPTLGSARAWLESGGRPRGAEIVQECGAGLVRIRREGDRFEFAAPPLVRGGSVDDADLEHIVRALRIEQTDVLDAQWCANGPEWVSVLLADADAVLRLDPDYPAFGRLPDIGVVGPGGAADFEVRAFIGPEACEDPVTGSLNAALAQWLIPAGYAPTSYVASQGTALGRRGRVYVHADADDVWIGGDTVVGIVGRVAP